MPLVWTDLPADVIAALRQGAVIPAHPLALDAARKFDARRQGLLEGTWCLDPAEKLSPGQAEEIDRVCATYPEFADDAFVGANLERWLA